MSCPTNDTLEQLALGFLESEVPVREHLKSCSSCAEVVRVLGQDHAALGRAAKQVPVPKVPMPVPNRTPWKMLAGVAACLFVGVGALVFTGGSKEAADSGVQPNSIASTGENDAEYWETLRRRGGSEEVLDQIETFHQAEGKKSVKGENLWAAVELTKVKTKAGAYDYRAIPANKEFNFAQPVAKPAMKKPVRARLAPAPVPPRVTTRSKLDPSRSTFYSVLGRTVDATSPTAKPVPVKPNPDEPDRPEETAGGLFKDHGINPAIDTSKEKVSTFALDVDTASYAMTRSYLRRGVLPPKESVRVEEFLNSIRYQDIPPARGSFGIVLEVAPSPFHAKRHLLRIAVLAKEISEEERKPVALTFVVDVSGSMNNTNRIGLVKQALTLLVNQLRPTDRVGIVAYGSNARKVLDLTSLDEKPTILAAIERLHCGGSTNAEAGLILGYQMAAAKPDPQVTNRVVLCSDGVANVGRTGPKAILKTIEAEAKKGITLTTLGFGMGSYNDHLMEQLADKGDGNYSYVDSYTQAKKIFTQELTGLLEVVGFDSKVQVEFNPETVATFRLVGYENRHVANRDFRNDAVDAGEIGSGHRVTAFYELELKEGKKGRLATVRLRYREADTKEQVEPMEQISVGQVPARLQDASPSFRLAASVMQFAEILRESPKAKGVTLAAVTEVARPAVREMDDPEDAREFLQLIEQAAKLKR